MKVTTMSKGLSEFVNDIINELNLKSCPDNDKLNLWDMAVHQIKEKNSLDGFYYDLIQSISNEYVNKLKDIEVMRIWKETETGMNSNYEPENVPIDSLKFDLEEEIMYEITSVAWSEAENHTWH